MHTLDVKLGVQTMIYKEKIVVLMTINCALQISLQDLIDLFYLPIHFGVKTQ
jgi:hypothetical protein